VYNLIITDLPQEDKSSSPGLNRSKKLIKETKLRDIKSLSLKKVN